MNGTGEERPGAEARLPGRARPENEAHLGEEARPGGESGFGGGVRRGDEGRSEAEACPGSERGFGGEAGLDDGTRRESEARPEAETGPGGGPRSGGDMRREDDGRPADAVRRALRAARERADDQVSGARAEQPAADVDAVSPGGDVEPATRPGDAARAALRRANTEHRSGRGAEADTAPAAESGEGPSGSARETRAVSGTARRETAAAGRPGDAAREALRAARREAERERTEAGTAGGGARRPSGAPGASGAPRGARGRRDTRARAGGAPPGEVRELLIGAFRTPTGPGGRGDHREEWRKEAPERPSHGTPSGSPGARHGTAHPAQDAAQEPASGPRSAPPGPPVAARHPRSMAAPGRDGELRRTFEALPARPAKDAERFAGTWWGDAWVAALEEGALDAARLARGRAYAGRGNVDAITVTPGLVLAYVQGSRPRPYRVQVRLRTFSDDEWDRFLDAAAERPGHIAALLDRQLPRSLAEGGVRLLPGPGDLEPHCGCPDSGHPCKHAAAVCYQTARLLDQDPLVLLLLRGRGERELLDALSRRTAVRAARAAQERKPVPVPGVRARDVVSPRALPPLPGPLPPPAHPEQPPVCPGVPGGPDPFALDQLATDAAARAHALLTTGHDPVAELTLRQDAVRLAAARPGSGLTAATRELYSSLAAATGRTPAELARAVAAWRQGGREALTVLEEPWDPPAGRFDRARPLLLAAGLPAFRPWRNRLTHPDGHTQLRLGRDGLWYAYESEPGREDWWPRGTPDPGPVGALTGLGAPGGETGVR